MKAKSHLLEAFMNKKDEFYTRYEDIEKEVRHYKEFFKGKTVYCNCDNPKYSNFIKFFKNNFKEYGLSRLIATFKSENPCFYEYDGVNEKTQPISDGDFASPECVEFLKQCDIVVTNPPFSLFRKFFDMLINNNKEFLVIGNLLACGYKQVFPHIKSGKVNIGYSFHNSSTFEIPKSYSNNKGAFEKDGKFYATVPARWFTTFPVANYIMPLTLTEDYSPDKYPQYENFDAINVDKTRKIPKDYYGVMGVPLSFIDFWNKDQFELLGLACRWSDMRTKVYHSCKDDLNAGGVINGKGKFQRMLIKRKV